MSPKPREWWARRFKLSERALPEFAHFDPNLIEHAREYDVNWEYFRVIEHAAFVELLAEAEALREAVAFYSDREHWEHSNAYAENTTVCGNDHYCYQGSYFYGGKIALKAAARFDAWKKERE